MHLILGSNHCHWQSRDNLDRRPPYPLAHLLHRPVTKDNEGRCIFQYCCKMNFYICTHRDDIRFEVTDVALAYGVVREAAAGYALKGMR